MPRRTLGVVGGDHGNAADVPPPGWLSEPATAHWRVLAPLTAPGTLTPATAPAFALLCTTLAAYVEADQLVNDAGILIASGGNDLVPNPALSIRDRADATLARWFSLFGLTPAQPSGRKPGGPRHLVES